MEKNNHPSQQNSEGGIGPIVGALIIVVVLIIAAVYYWAQHLNLLAQERELQAAQETALQASQSGAGGSGKSATSSTLGTSTKISDIEKDLNTVTTTNLK